MWCDVVDDNSIRWVLYGVFPLFWSKAIQFQPHTGPRDYFESWWNPVRTFPWQSCFENPSYLSPGRAAGFAVTKMRVRPIRPLSPSSVKMCDIGDQIKSDEVAYKFEFYPLRSKVCSSRVGFEPKPLLLRCSLVPIYERHSVVGCDGYSGSPRSTLLKATLVSSWKMQKMDVPILTGVPLRISAPAWYCLYLFISKLFAKKCQKHHSTNWHFSAVLNGFESFRNIGFLCFLRYPSSFPQNIPSSKTASVTKSHRKVWASYPK